MNAPKPGNTPGSSALSLVAKLLLPTAFALSWTGLLSAQTVAPANAGAEDDDGTVVLSPFVVDTTQDRGYQATSTLAGTRIRTNLADVGSSISVITREMLTDLGATNNESILQYAVNTEIGGPRGNFTGGVRSGTYEEQALFTNPNGNTRVRGLTSADNTRNFFISDVPWEGYTVSRVDLQRGPNAILFGLGSPAGVVNATINSANFNGNKGRVELSYDRWGSQRYVADYNQTLLPQELAVRVTLLRNDQEFQQQPAFSLDQRGFAALKYRPNVLNRNGTFFEFSANFEKGEIRSNRPRIVTPVDRFSRWWESETEGGAGQKTFNFLTQRLGDNASPNRTRVLGGGGLGGVVDLINSNRSADWVIDSVSPFRSRRPDGTIIMVDNDGANGVWPRSNSLNRVGLRSYSEWAADTGKPFASFGGYDDRTITDASVFNFYEKLIDGPNKREWTDWHVFDLNLSNTFFNNTLGYDISVFRQRLERGQWSALGWSNMIWMDVNDVNTDNQANPDVGRAYVQLEDRNGGNNLNFSDRDAHRVQLFGEHDFAENRDGWLTRLIGLHRLTALLSEENHQSDFRSFRYSHLDPTSMAQFVPNPRLEGNMGTSTGFRYYLSDDLRSRATAAGSDVSNLAMPFLPRTGGPISVRHFDKTWTADPSVAFNAPWANPSHPEGTYTQSNNPANYRGWTTTQANLVTIHSDQQVNGMSARDYLTVDGTKREFNVESKTLVWQGYLWDRAVIGTYGYREDKARNYVFLTSDRAGNARPDTNSADLNPSTYNFSNPKGSVTNLETETRNWSVAAHLNRLLGERDFLPINVSLYYNEGENFQPLAGRIDAARQPVPPPAGSTNEVSVLLATKDNRYSLRATKYETEVLNANSTGGLGAMWALEQVLYFTSDLARDLRSGRTPTTEYVNSGGDANRLMNEILPAWFAMEKDFRAKFPDYVAAWFRPGTSFGTDSNDPVQGAGAPSGFAFTEDSKSEGYEFELTANPTPNWRIALNASRTEATRQNVPGTAFRETADYLETAMQTTSAGLAPVWWPGNVGGGRAVGPWTIFRPDYMKLSALNGQSAGEVREWRANFITNYSFTEGALKGWGAGTGIRWEDRAIIDYAPMRRADGSDTINLNAPFYAPDHQAIDLWLSYSRRLSRDIDWRIQLNVYNAFGKNELVPFAASVDWQQLQGVTLTPETVIPMRASAFTIREGMSWQLSTTFEF